MDRHRIVRRFGRFLRPYLLAAAYLLSGPIIHHAKSNPFYDAGPVASLASSAAKNLPQERRFSRGQIVTFATQHRPGTVIVNTVNNRLFLILPGGKAVRYAVATAKPGFEWTGTHKVSAKMKWPDWRPPEEMRKRKPELPEFMAGGPDNPLGARALYLGSSIYRIHGTNEPQSIGKSASSGCIRMRNEDVTELFQHVKTGALVIVM